MLYREIIAVCSQIHTEHINTLFGQNVEFINLWVCRDFPGFDDGLQVRHQKFLSLSAVFFREKFLICCYYYYYYYFTKFFPFWGSVCKSIHI